jgi:high affinity Mn2+ porin
MMPRHAMFRLPSEEQARPFLRWLLLLNIWKRARRRLIQCVWLGAPLLLVAMAVPSARGQDGLTPDQGEDPTASEPPDSLPWEVHMQSTVVAQGHPSFYAKYTGANSMTPGASIRETVSVDVTGGVRLWRGGEFFGDVLTWQGYGLNNSLGLAGFSSGEAYRVGKTYPDAYLCRAYLRETIGFGGGKEASDDGLGGTKDVRNLTFTVGHFSVTDIFDSNAYAKDPRSQFLNWVLVNNGAWDYPADALGYTTGAAAELNTSAWTWRAGVFQVSKVANGIRMDWNLAHAWSAEAELERRYSPRGHAGTLRLLAYDQRAHMGSYQDTLNNPSLGEQIVLTAAYRYKYGFGINLDQEIRKNLGVFARLGWNDGKNQSYEFTDVDRTATAGISLKGERWRRPEDTAAVAVIVNGISSVHRQYLAAGGLGILVGDGALDYRPERIAEMYYNWRISKHYHLSPDYQLAVDPAYNHVRGPINLFALRFHTEF